jgi:hypothetical protein
LEDVVKVYVIATNGSHLAFGTIGDKAGYIPKVMERSGQEVNVILLVVTKMATSSANKEVLIVDTLPPECMEVALLGSFMENVVERVNGHHKEER